MIVTSNGYILTNRHVISSGGTLTIQLADGRQFDGTVVGTDPTHDVAVVKISATGLPTVTLGNSDKLQITVVLVLVSWAGALEVTGVAVGKGEFDDSEGAPGRQRRREDRGRAPTTRSRGSRPSAQTSARWRMRAAKNMWSGWASDTVAAAQTVPTKPKASAIPIAMSGRTPSRIGGRRSRDGPRDEERRREVKPNRNRREWHELSEPAQDDVGRVAGRMGDAEDVRDGRQLTPVAPSDARHERPGIDDEGDDARDQRGETSQVDCERHSVLKPHHVDTL
jgi:hypothetical protein